MLETYKVGVVLELGGNVQTGIDKLIGQMEALDRRTKDAGSAFAKLARDIDAIGKAGRSIQALSRAMDKLGGGAGRGVADFERMATSAKSMTEASERMTVALRDSAKLAADVARAAEAAGRAGATSSRSGGHRASREHDIMLAGIGAAAAGGTILHGSESAFERGMEVAHLRTQVMADQRVSQERADQLINQAYAATASAPGTRVASNIEAGIDLKNLTGSLEEAEKLLPAFARLTALLQLVDRRKGGSGDPAFAAGKAMEVMGGMVEEREVDGHTVRENNGELLQKRLDMIARVAVATNGRVAPQDFLGFAKQARVAGMTLSDEFIYEKLPALILGMGGARAGTALMSMAQVFRGGKLQAGSMEALQEIGLAGAGGITMEGQRRNKRGELVGGHKVVHSDAIYDLPLMGTDPSAWVEAAQKRMEAAGVHGTQAQIDALMKAAQRSTIAGILAQLLKDQPAIAKEAENIRNTRPDVAGYFAQNDPAAKLQQMQAAFDKLMTTLGSSMMADAVKLMDLTTAGLNKLSEWAKENPTMAKVLVETATGLGAIAAALGTLSAAILFFGPALRLLGFGGGAAATGAAGGAAAAGSAGGWLGAVSRAAMSAGAGGAALTAGAIYLGGTTDPIEAEKQLQRSARQVRRSAILTPQDAIDPATGYPARAPIQLRGDLNVDGRKLGEFVAGQVGRGMSGPRTGAIGSDLTINPWMIPLAN